MPNLKAFPHGINEILHSQEIGQKKSFLLQHLIMAIMVIIEIPEVSTDGRPPAVAIVTVV